MIDFERRICAQEFLSYYLTSRERMLVASFSLGYNQAEVARAWNITPAAVNRMLARIHRKANLFWRL